MKRPDQLVAPHTTFIAALRDALLPKLPSGKLRVPAVKESK
jgi:hypothetical protein